MDGNAMTGLTRRGVLAGGASGLAAAALPQAARAAAPAAGAQASGVYRHRIGSFELTALYDGTWSRKIDGTFVRNASGAEVERALRDAFLPPGVVPTSFTPLLVNTGSKLVLIDAGSGGQFGPGSGALAGNLAAAGVDPKAIDAIVISHFHPDHISGIKTKDGAKVFPNAEISVPAPEWAYWMDDGNLSRAPDAMKGVFLNARRVFANIAKQVKPFQPGREVAPGVTSIAAYGHTPGHSAFAVASGHQSMLVLSDTTNHPWLFARHPDWQGIFDMDGDQAVANRKRLLDRAAADRMLVQGYHFPFPASGHIAKTATGYEIVPVMWRPL